MNTPDKKVITGWLWVAFEDTALYETKEEMEKGIPPEFIETLNNQLEPFHGTRVKITVEPVYD